MSVERKKKSTRVRTVIFPLKVSYAHLHLSHRVTHAVALYRETLTRGFAPEERAWFMSYLYSDLTSARGWLTMRRTYIHSVCFRNLRTNDEKLSIRRIESGGYYILFRFQRNISYVGQKIVLLLSSPIRQFSETFSLTTPSRLSFQSSRGDLTVCCIEIFFRNLSFFYSKLLHFSSVDPFAANATCRACMRLLTLKVLQ